MSQFNCEAMAVVVVDLLYDMPPDKRLEVAALALERLRDDNKNTEFVWSVRHFHEISVLEARAAYRFIRRITNNNSADDAANLLFRQHHGVSGSGYLEEYLNRLPHKTEAAEA